MDYRIEFRKFASSQHLYSGLRITAGVIIPAVILYRYGLLYPMIGIPLGALFVGLTDNPGPIVFRRNGMLVSIVINFLVAVLATYSRVSPFMICMEIIVFGLFFSLIAVYGTRANTIGLIALIVFTLTIDASQQPEPLMHGLYLTIGGCWYALLSLGLYTLRPYRPIQQLLGASLMETAEYLRTRAQFYNRDRNEEPIFRQLMQQQVNIRDHHEELREMLFTTRKVLSESTRKGRVLMMAFLDSIDLLERIMTSQQDYNLLHEQFGDSGIMEELRGNIIVLANELHHIGLAVQEGYAYKSSEDLDNRLQQSMDAFVRVRAEKLNPDTVEGLISLRHIIYSLEDVTERIKRLQTYTTYDRRISRQYKREVDTDRFISSQEININLLTDNLTIKSGTFRHAVRITTALLIGYIVSLLFPFGHGYWILLTIAVIMKPAYSITRQRNIQRLAGTFTGAAIGFGILLLSPNTTLMFIIMVTAMVISYSLLKLQYMVSTAALTVFILLMFFFLSPSDLNTILRDRVIDTAIGSMIAYLVSTFLLPAWEFEQIDGFIDKAIMANRNYFMTVAQNFTGSKPDVNSYKIARKEAFVSLANLSDTFQRMMSEPKSQQPNLPAYHQFVSASHMLTSYIASLSYYAARFGSTYVHEDFGPMINEIRKKFDLASTTLTTGVEQTKSAPSRLPIHKKVQQLLEQRKREITEGIESDMVSVRRVLSDLKTITDQFQLIHANLNDQVKILKKIRTPFGVPQSETSMMPVN